MRRTVNAGPERARADSPGRSGGDASPPRLPKVQRAVTEAAKARVTSLTACRPLFALFCLLFAAFWGNCLFAQPPAGSQLSPDANNCLTCHSEAALWEGDTLRLYISQESLANDVHFLGGVNCHDCHGGDPSSLDVPQAHSTVVAPDAAGVLPFRSPIAEVKKVCGNCHQAEAQEFANGKHGPAAGAAEPGQEVPQDCARCHGGKTHGMVSVKDRRSPVFLDNQTRLCGECHGAVLETYLRSVHGHGLQEAGLLVTAVCADCHGAHAVYSAADQRSTLYATNVAGTCGKCHRFIERQLQKSVHTRGNGLGGPTEIPAPGGQTKRHPTCTDCHQGHDFPRATSARFRRGLPNLCGDCHQQPYRDYDLSVHGELTELGYGPAAKCSDCHGAHEILAVSDPDSMLSPVHRLTTCRKCHSDAPHNFTQFDPHADHHNPARDPLLHWVYLALISFLIFMFCAFGVHSALWLVRSGVEVKQYGRPRSVVPGGIGYIRFKPFHRRAHTIMVVSFLGLALTGLPLKYSSHEWAQLLARWLGGFDSTSLWHRFFGLLNFGCLLAYLVRMVAAIVVAPRRGRSRWETVFGPDSPLPTWRDLKDLMAVVRWCLWLGPKPTFERWAYWEKVDFWGACADIVIIGFTGLMLWFPNFFCSFLPGESLNVAKVIHSTQALLATGFVFAVHFFATHMRPEKFPMDLAVFTGLVSEEELREERPELLQRLQQTGVLDEMKRTVPSRRRLLFIRLGGWLALITGTMLLIGIVIGLFVER